MNKNINKAIKKLTSHNYLLIRVGKGDVLSVFDSLTEYFHMDHKEKSRVFFKENGYKISTVLLLNIKTMELYHYVDSEANINAMYSRMDIEELEAKQILRLIKLTKLNERILSI